MALKLRLDELEIVAQRAGFADFKSLLDQWYTAEEMSLVEIGERLHVSWPRVRKHLVRYGISVRGPGGPNNVLIVVTNELIQEIARDGIPAAAARLGVQENVLYARIRRWIALHPEVTITPEDSDS
jgi:hypothetical protein